MILIDTVPDQHAAMAALAILSHPASLSFDLAAASRLVRILEKDSRSATEAEWRFLDACHAAVLHAERAVA